MPREAGVQEIFGGCAVGNAHEGWKVGKIGLGRRTSSHDVLEQILSHRGWEGALVQNAC